MNNIRNKTDYLRGLAIFMVILGHYLKRVFHDSPHSAIIGGNGFVAIFFLLSGFGIYYSLRKILTPDTMSWQALGKFYLKRAKRIYPLYWLFLGTKYIFFDIFHRVPITLLDILGLQFSNPHILWFIPAIIQCYLIAPLLLYFVQKINVKALFIGIIVVTCGNFIASMLGVPHERIWVYRGIYFNGILLFFIGMIFPILLERRINRYASALSVTFLFILFLTAIYLQFAKILPFPADTAVDIMFTIAASVFVYYFIQLKGLPPFSGLFSRMGLYSYSLYIFHGVLLSVIAKLGLIQNQPLYHVAVYVCFLIFFPLIAFLEECVNNKLDLKQSWLAFSKNLLAR